MSMTEIIVNLIDNASQALESIRSNAESAFSGVESAAEQSSAGLENAASAAEQTGAAMDNVSGASLDEAAASAEVASGSLEQAAASADQAGAAADSISDQAINQAASSATALGGSFDEAAMAADQTGAATESISDQAINQAASSASALGSGLDEAALAADQTGAAVESVSGQSLDNASKSADSLKDNLDQAAKSADDAAEKTEQIGTAAQNAEDMSTNSMLAMTLGIGGMTAGLEASAREANNTNATFEKMASVKFPEDQLRSMVANLTNVKFPVQDALLYIRTLRQIGVTSIEAQNTGAKAFNTIAVGAGVGSEEVVKFSNSMVAMGMDMENIPAAYNAIAYANANMVGGFQTYINWMQKYDSTFKEMGLNIDQTAVLISAATKKFGGGRAAYTGLNEAIKESNGDLTVLEQKLGMQPGALSRASEETAKYSGKLEKNAQISREHTTILEQAQAWLSDLSTQYGDLIGTVGSFGGIIGGVTGTVTAMSTAHMALAGSIGTETAAENTSTLAKIRGRIASAANILTNYTSASSYSAAVGAAMAHAGAVNANTAAQNTSIGTTIRNTISTAAGTVAKGAATAATMAQSAAQWALNAAMSANPILIVVIAIMALIAVLGYLYFNNEQVRGAVDGLWKGLQALGAYIWGGLVAAWNALTVALKPITDALGHLGGAILGRLMQAITPLIAAVQAFWASLTSGAGSGAGDIFNQLGSAVMWVWSVLEPFVNVILAGLSAMLQTIVGIISGVITFIATLINILAELVAGNITFEQAMGMVWNAFGTLVMTVLTSVMNGIGKFAIELVQKGISAAQQFLAGIVTWFSQLPGKAWALLLLVVNRVLTWRTQMIARAKETGQNFINGVISFIQTLPGKAWTWFLNTLGKIVSFASQAYSRATQVGSNIINAIRDYLAGLPGQMYQWGVNAINSFIDAIINAIPGLRGALDMVASLFPRSPPKEGPLSEVTEKGMYKYGESLGTAFGEGINDTTGEIFSNLTPPGPFDIPTPVSSPAAGAMAATTPTQPMNTSVGLDTSALAEGNQQAQGIIAGTVSFASEEYGLMQTNVANAWAGMATTTSTGFQGIQQNMQSTLTQIVANNQVGYNQLKNNTASSVTAMVTSNKNSYNTMQKNMSNTLTAITSDNKSKYTSILNTTKTTLNTLQTKTNDSMGQVKTSWNGMRNSLISAASQVRSQTTNEINRLSGNIAVFYRKIQNPALLLAGPVPSRYRNKPWWTHPVGRAGGFAGPGSGSSNKEIKRLDTSPGIPCDTWYDCHFAGSWDYSDPWIQEIMSIVHGYRPSFYDMGSLGLTVGDFENSTWPVSGNMQLFDALAARIVGRSHYSFYYDSNGLSPYQNAMNGAYNCWDGAMIMIALANALGLPAYMAHGYWGNIGHVWAVVNGQMRDTTAFQGGYGWSSPKVHAGPGPKNFTDFSSNNEPLVIEERYTFDWNISFPDGVPEHIDEAMLTDMLMEQIDDPEVVKKLVKNRGFLERLKTELSKYDLRIARAQGS